MDKYQFTDKIFASADRPRRGHAAIRIVHVAAKSLWPRLGWLRQRSAWALVTSVFEIVRTFISSKVRPQRLSTCLAGLATRHVRNRLTVPVGVVHDPPHKGWKPLLPSTGRFVTTIHRRQNSFNGGNKQILSQMNQRMPSCVFSIMSRYV